MIFWIIAGGNTVSAQELRIGDTLPDCLFQNVLRYSSPSVRLSDFRGKILILDLWRTTCGHAVASFAHFDSLQQQFPGKLSALAITTERREEVAQYLTTNSFAARTKLPVVTNDSLLAGKRFHFIYIPHVVVADARGTIVAIVSPEQVTPEVIQSLVDKKPVMLREKKEIVDFDYETPIVNEGSGRNIGQVAYLSTFTHRLPGVISLQSVDTLGDKLLYKAYNVSIPELYAEALHLLYRRNQTILDVRDTPRFINRNYDDEDWQQHNLWCYNLLLPKGSAFPEKTALADFNRFFGVTGSVEERKLKCLLLVKKGDRWKANHTDEESYYLDSGRIKVAHNVVVPFVVDAWNYVSDLPVLDETGLGDARLDIRIEGTPNALTAFRSQLQTYDLDLVPAIRKMKVLVIRERKEKRGEPGGSRADDKQ